MPNFSRKTQNNLLPKLVPQFIKRVDMIQGGGGSGTIEQINITQDVHFKCAKYRNDEMDKENLVCKYTMIEGDALLMKSNLCKFN
ncbi:Bet v I/Major latex protein, partial [Dillenia turbinata]